jgi:hypothetical protein
MLMKFRRCLVILGSGAVLTLSATAAPAFASAASSASVHAATPHITSATPAEMRAPATGPREMAVNVANVDNDCFTPGVIYTVADPGIHIKQLPNGNNLASIGQKQWFDSEVEINGKGPYHCVTSATVAGQFWVLGFKNADPSVYGYVGLNWLNFLKYVS